VLDIGHSGDALDLLVGADALRGGLCGNRPRPAAQSGHPTGPTTYASWIRNYGDEGLSDGVTARWRCWSVSGSGSAAPNLH
jgi:thiaminase/transcriptional activator TenA